MCPVWLLVVVVVVGMASGAVNQCWERPSCQELKSDSSMMECIQLCRSDVAELQAPPPSDLSSFLFAPSSSSPQVKSSYSMEHFRWGKPVGRKRGPVKVYTSNGVEEESVQPFPVDMRRRRLEEEEEQPLSGQDTMKRSHWAGPSANKRYGGFVKSWDGRSQRPLLTLFKNVINKNGPRK